MPNELREGVVRARRAEYADDHCEIVLPTALPGISTGIMLAVARVAGETAPLLLTVLHATCDQHEPVHRAAGVAAARSSSTRPAPGHQRADRPGLGRGADPDHPRHAAQPRRPADRPTSLSRKTEPERSTSIHGQADRRHRPEHATTAIFQAVEGVTLTVEPRTVTAFIGPSGCGKSTFLRTLNRMHEVIPGARVEGKVMLDDEDIYGSGVDPVDVRRTIGMVFQRPNPFPTMSIYDNVAAGLQLAGRRSKADLDDVVERSLRGAEPLGRGQGPAEQARARACPAASSSGCASPGRSR